MKEFPQIPPLAEAPPELLSGGHLWIQEKIDGAGFRFVVRESGLLVFGDRSRVYEDGVPEPYRHAARHVREHFDVDAFRNAAESVEDVTFFGEATTRQAIDYDFDRLPSFLGFDVWSERTGAFLPPDAVERVFRTLGLTPVNTFTKEARAIDFDPDSYEIPDSAWYDGPAAGVVLRNKNGTRAKLLDPRYENADGTMPTDASPEALARRCVTDRRVKTAVTRIEDRGRAPTFERVYERVVEDVIREEHNRLLDGEASIDRDLRSAVAAQVHRYLDDA